MTTIILAYNLIIASVKTTKKQKKIKKVKLLQTFDDLIFCAKSLQKFFLFFCKSFLKMGGMGWTKMVFSVRLL